QLATDPAPSGGWGARARRARNDLRRQASSAGCAGACRLAPPSKHSARLFSGDRPPRSLLGREAVEEACASGALEVVLAAAAVRPTGGMRRVPRLGRVVVAQSLTVGMTHHRRALAALRPVAARLVLAGGERGAVRLRAGEDVVHVRRVAAAVDDVAL